MLFERDIFSVSRPGWTEVSSVVKRKLADVLSFLPTSFLPLLAEPEQSNALSINSRNFRLVTSQGTFLLKQWSHSAEAVNLENILAVMTWLASRKLPVLEPIKFKGGELLLQLNSGTWSLFPFVEGEYFSGVGGELEAAAEVTGQLMEALSQLPSNYVLGAGAKYLTAADGELLRCIEHHDQLEQLFGPVHANLLLQVWPALMMEWHRLVDGALDAGGVQAAHFDLHPHNLLVSSNHVVAVLDFESCKLMPVGYALGFAALKQCRQAVALSQLPSDAALVGARYVERLVDCHPNAGAIANRMGDFAVSEVLRRICLILRLNLESGNKEWNHVLPVQLAHIGEARALFG